MLSVGDVHYLVFCWVRRRPIAGHRNGLCRFFSCDRLRVTGMDFVDFLNFDRLRVTGVDFVDFLNSDRLRVTGMDFAASSPVTDSGSPEWTLSIFSSCDRLRVTGIDLVDFLQL